MTEFLNEIWPYIEIYGPFPFAIISGALLWSINPYLWNCANLSLMQQYYNTNGSLSGYKKPTHSIAGFSEIKYAFIPFSSFDPKLNELNPFKNQLNNLKTYRKVYKLMFPILFFVLVSSILINSYLIKS